VPVDASGSITIYLKAGGTLPTTEAKHKEANIFPLVPPELQGGSCSHSAGCPEGVLLHGWCWGHDVMGL